MSKECNTCIHNGTEGKGSPCILCRNFSFHKAKAGSDAPPSVIKSSQEMEIDRLLKEIAELKVQKAVTRSKLSESVLIINGMGELVGGQIGKVKRLLQETILVIDTDTDTPPQRRA